MMGRLLKFGLVLSDVQHFFKLMEFKREKYDYDHSLKEFSYQKENALLCYRIFRRLIFNKQIY